MGKTALALSMLRNAALDSNIGVGMFSLEMANNQLAMRLLCAEARVDSHYVRTGKLPTKLWKNLGISAGNLENAPIYLDDTPALNVLELRAKFANKPQQAAIARRCKDQIRRASKKD